MDIFKVIDWAFNIYYIMIFVYILFSWFPNVQGSPVGTLLGRLVEPYLSVFRRFIPPIGVIDLSPIVALFALHFIRIGVFAILAWILRLF
ncbi:YggT family protein [Paenactinomyces guangxiensis]|uniref:YggT family protein n=1 Tax=Paenactinomyces guangxiensis TaxID=1490290 RepID=A0A7W1WQI8_9BACL|nr:YggT family protein [Paenactinomyces guangxiensis]MBA4494232.1 YggT family protein [Paenactinomyces guangxiensis]MBH8590728.1 YggT family protein [Paenactinomyces guangxiensis]